MTTYAHHISKVFVCSVSYAFWRWPVVAKTCKGNILYTYIKLVALDEPYYSSMYGYIFTVATDKSSVLFIYGLFNDLVSTSYYLASYGTMVNELWIRKAVEGSGTGLFHGTILDRLRKPQKKLSVRIAMIQTMHLPK
jgi:hypothetical protein